MNYNRRKRRERKHMKKKYNLAPNFEIMKEFPGTEPPKNKETP